MIKKISNMIDQKWSKCPKNCWTRLPTSQQRSKHLPSPPHMDVSMDQPLINLSKSAYIPKKNYQRKSENRKKKIIQKKNTCFQKQIRSYRLFNPHALTRRATVSWFRSVTVVWRVWRGMAMGKTMGKWWKIHGKIRCKWSKSRYPPVMTNITIENGHLS